MATIKWNAEGAIRIISRSANTAIGQIMQEVMEKAVADCPKDTGYLASTAFLRENEKSTVVGFTAPYAAIQHENLGYNHPNGKAKFLEDAFNEIVPGAISRIKRKISENL